MQEFGDFANIDIDKLLKGVDEQFVLMEKFQRDIGTYVGRAQDENGMVTVEYDHQGVRELELHPKAMRMASGELADLIKTAIADATADFQKQLSAAMGELFGDDADQMKFVNNPDAALTKIKEAGALHEQAFTDVMGQLDRIRRRLNL
ncbi:YbaB/EbfC family nucleoid-associated protein [Nonomuraea turkmeniaca]|uniref:YbaB/EbfC family nucleoid-associated protein n=1 Tax=Nonomuraea turkmeniaca TaxID=103838 RepID=A0A5S4EV82_9ACTN|nr:YbaB/EbfC family nucleoid-associated protein [Nonomuraea turkmeniaca]TMR05728.1 YbaB/EbfC family nucleoid-associated protein [Nonomuraea turkmeniaca]